MHDIYITYIKINKVRHLQDIDIALSETERKNLILTGKNGSGKTSLLQAIGDDMFCYQKVYYRDIGQVELMIRHQKSKMSKPNMDVGIKLSHQHDYTNLSEIIFVYKSAERSKFTLPGSIEAIEKLNISNFTQNASSDFLRYSINLDYQLLGAQNDSNKKLETVLKKWFDNLLAVLQEIYACKELKLHIDRKNLRIWIEMPGREPFGLHEMADGYAAFLDIYMELIMRFEGNNAEVEYEKQAIVLIDEIETHLHVELQKRILPFLTKMFPNVQFIVSTHSPFVINSITNAVVYDLEKREQLDNPSYYSYETIIESFLDADMYSEVLKRNFERYKELCFIKRTPDENEEFLRAKTELELMAPASKELYIAFRELEQQRKEAKNDKVM